MKTNRLNTISLSKKGIKFNNKQLLLLIAAAIVGSLLIASQALAVHNLGLLELDGDPIAGNASPPVGPATDWSALFTAAGVPNALPPNAISSFFTGDSFGRDGITGTGPDYSTFTTGSKDIYNPSGPGNNNWQCASATNDALDKDNLIHGYGIAYIAPSTNGGVTAGDTIIYLGDEKFSDGGDNNIGVWLFQSPVSCDSTAGTATFTGSHTVGDLLIISNFTQGGTLSGIQIYQWVGTGGEVSGTLHLLASDAACSVASATDTACGAVNTATVSGFTWPTTNKETKDSTSVSTNAFYEMGIDVTALEPNAGCFTGVLMDTRTSASPSATIKDYLLGNLSTCVHTTTTTHASQTGTVAPGTPVTDTASVTASVGTPGGSVQFYWCGALASASGCNSATGTALGSPVTLSGGSATSSPISPTAVGHYCFAAY